MTDHKVIVTRHRGRTLIADCSAGDFWAEFEGVDESSRNAARRAAEQHESEA